MAQFIGYGDSRDGSVSTANGTINSYAAMSGSAGSTTVTTALSVSAGDHILLITMRGANVGQWELVKVLSTGSGEFTADRNLVNTYAGLSQAIKGPQYSAGTCSNNLTGTAWNGTIGGVIFATINGSAVFTGTITAPSGFVGGSTTNGYSGEGSAGASAQQITANGNGGGGGQNPGQSGGAGGGNGAAGTNGSVEGGKGLTASSGGSAVGSAALTSLFMGGGGGRGWGSAGSQSGAAGSGIILLIGKSIDVSSATVALNGTGLGAASGNDAGGGGGAGGSCLIKCITATLGTNKITASGGAGGTATFNGNGGAGAVGRIHIDYATSYTGTTTPTIDATKDPTLNPSNNFFMFF